MAWLRNNKKGQAEVQFNWIFVLVVGGIILIFFTAIVLKQKSVSEQKLSATMAADLETIFAGASVSKGTSHMFEIPNLEMNFDCSRFYMGQINKPLGKQVIFAPSKVKGDKLLTLTLEWNVPFKSSNFLFVTSPDVRYIFVYDSSSLDLLGLINDSLPSGLNAEFYEAADANAVRSLMNSISDKNNYKVRFVFVVSSFDENSLNNFNFSKLSGMVGDDLTALLIKPSGGSVKNVYFFKSNGGSFVLVGDSISFDFVSPREEVEALPSLLGAIISDDLESYNCIMRKAFERLELVSSIYLDKVDKLNNFYVTPPGKPVCANFVDATTPSINVINSEASGCKTDFYGGDCGDSSITSIAAAATNLEAQNRVLLFRSCALIY